MTTFDPESQELAASAKRMMLAVFPTRSAAVACASTPVEPRGASSGCGPSPKKASRTLA
jgi:hypothetical protein